MPDNGTLRSVIDFDPIEMNVLQRGLKMMLPALGVLCFCVVCGMLAVGLWPFHNPKNDVSWVDGQGVLLGPHGSMVSHGVFNATVSEKRNACSLEVLLQPLFVHHSGTILAYYCFDL